jgi:hypothetical protein
MAASVGTLDPQSRAELAWTTIMIAVDTGDDPAALAARQRLAPLLAGISDPFLHAVSQLAMAWTVPITGDLDGALQETAVSLEVSSAAAAAAAGIARQIAGYVPDNLRPA